MSAPVARRAALVRGALAAILGVAAALLVACGGSSDKLIPSADAGPLQSDFEAVEQAADSGGDCSGTESALTRTQQDFEALPASVDAGLRNRLREGISQLRQDALTVCAQSQTQSVSTQSKTTPKTTSTTQTSTTETQTTSTTSTTATTPSEVGAENGGGTRVPTETTPGVPAVPGAAGGTGPPGLTHGVRRRRGWVGGWWRGER